jgi:histidyl-tRNA synthetase
MAINSPIGINDMLPEEELFWEQFQEKARDVFGRYGYSSIEVPILEQTELFVRGIGEATDVVSKEMFVAFSGENLKTLLAGEKLESKSRLSLRPEGTAGVVRSVVQNNLVPQGAAPAKLMYAGPMFRAERPQRGRYRQFHQIGIECLGAEEPSIDAEAIIMLMRFYEEAGISQDKLTLLINSMGCENCRPAYRDAVRAYMDEHADELCDTCNTRKAINPLRAFDCKNNACKKVMDAAPKITDHLCPDCKAHYEQVKSYLDLAGVYYVEDPKLVRGLDYYTRTVFEVQADDGLGSQNAIGGGGRYDKLAQDVGGNPTPGLGFAIGFERCKFVLEACGYEFPKINRCDVFIACVNCEVHTAAFKLLQQYRDSGIKAEMDHQSRSLKSQFKLADKMGAAYVAILGPDELAQGKYKLRNMTTHEEELRDIDYIAALEAKAE